MVKLPSADSLGGALSSTGGIAGLVKGKAGGSIEDPDGEAASATLPLKTKDSVRAYIALTKPRIIELLLVTTVPAMVLATREVPGIQFGHWAWLTVWTLVGGTLAAGSANAINCYLDRDIDELMVRTRRRPLPAHQVDPERAVVFGLVLGAISFAVLAFFASLLAAFLALLAIAFYVVVYTIVMKRTTPQNIVIGGAAGAVPPLVGYAAATGNLALPALWLFLIVFLWQIPHFMAIAWLYRDDYAKAGIQFLPVIDPEGGSANRQIVSHCAALLAVSLPITCWKRRLNSSS